MFTNHEYSADKNLCYMLSLASELQGLCDALIDTTNECEHYHDLLVDASNSLVDVISNIGDCIGLDYARQGFNQSELIRQAALSK